MKTELVWDGKYDEYLRRLVDVAGKAPMQKIETVDMPRSRPGRGQTTLGELKTTRQYDFRNMLIWGDNKLVMASLLKDFKKDRSDLHRPALRCGGGLRCRCLWVILMMWKKTNRS